MNLLSETKGDIRIVTVPEARIDAAVAIQFKDAMRTETEQGPQTVLLDLSAVNFIDSSGLGAIVAAMKQLGQDKTLELAGLTPTVDKVFRLTRMDSVFTLHQTLGEALASHGI